MSTTEELRGAIQAELDELEQFSKQYLMNELAGGQWYDVLMRAALAGHEPAIDPDLPRIVLASNWLEEARRCAALEGQLRADAYTPAVANTLGPKGSAQAVPIPDEAMGFVTDLLYTTRMHLRLAHDLCTLNGRTIDVDKAEDLHTLVRIAFGHRSGEILYETVRMTLPVIDSQGFFSATEGVGTSFPAIIVPSRGMIRTKHTHSISRMRKETEDCLVRVDTRIPRTIKTVM